MALPFRALSQFVFFAVIFAAVIISQSFFPSYSVATRIVIGYAAFEGIGIVVLLLVLHPLAWALKRLFFFFIDVVPAHGANAEEARQIALNGRIFELNKKIENEIENWSIDDTDEYASLMNWRVRLLGTFRKRMYRIVRELQQIYEETGKQPRDMGYASVDELFRKIGVKAGWLEKVFVEQWSFNAIFALTIISIAIAVIEAQHV